MKQDKLVTILFCVLGLVSVIWLALLTAPHIAGGLPGIIEGLPKAIEQPFSFELCKDSGKTVLLFLIAYLFGLGIYVSTRRNYRKG
ncbi:type IV secretory system conjugative DNA transfer family protein, partial [Anaerovorax odorimutans]|nr:type IV secretory system conjugative DNA transfer family protein [Anaerovorax odorimutans]